MASLSCIGRKGCRYTDTRLKESSVFVLKHPVSICRTEAGQGRNWRFDVETFGYGDPYTWSLGFAKEKEFQEVGAKIIIRNTHGQGK